MSEIEVGEYVRTNNDYIRKIVTERFNGYVVDVSYYNEIIDDTTLGIIGKEDIKKHSKQLIDLIEVGDYVNGREVKHIAMFEGFPDYPKLIFVDETYLIPDDTCENDEIKTILTKEIYMANCYKIGGDNEI